MTTDLPKGLYKGPDGHMRFWDGEAWYDQPAEVADAADAPTPESMQSGNAPSGTRRRLWGGIAIAVVVALLVGGALAIKTAKDNQAAETAAAQQVADTKAAEEAAKKAADAAAAQTLADQQQAAADAQAAQEAKDVIERASRAAAVKGIEASVLKMAKTNAKNGVTKGPIKSVSCVPVAGGSTDDLTQKTTKFECFAVYKVNSDGTSDGYYYNATENWADGSYTYGFGKD